MTTDTIDPGAYVVCNHGHRLSNCTSCLDGWKMDTDRDDEGIACVDCGVIGGHGMRWSMCSGRVRLIAAVRAAKLARLALT